MKNKLCMVALVLFSFNALSEDFSNIVDFYCKKENIDPLLVKSIIYHESRGNVHATSHVGARGLMQVMPDTARFVGVDPKQLYDPESNIKAGVLYLGFLKQFFHGNVEKMVAAYNAGHYAVKKYGGIPPYKETINYTKMVLAKYYKNENFAINVPNPRKQKITNINSSQFVFISANDNYQELKNSNQKAQKNDVRIVQTSVKEATNSHSFYTNNIDSVNNNNSVQILNNNAQALSYTNKSSRYKVNKGDVRIVKSTIKESGNTNNNSSYANNSSFVQIVK